MNNEHFIAVQQDLRKIEDVRLLTYYKLMSNGELKSLDSYSNDMLFSLQSLLETSRNDQQVLCNNRHNSRFSRLKPVILFNQNCQTTEPMDITPPATVATLEQQIEWEKCGSPVSELTYYTFISQENCVTRLITKLRKLFFKVPHIGLIKIKVCMYARQI